MITDKDVVHAYSKLLDRQPESVAAISLHMQSYDTVDALYLAIMASTEYTSNQARKRSLCMPENLRQFLPQTNIDLDILCRDVSGQIGMYVECDGLDTLLNAIRIRRPTGRFGNNFFQIVNALIVASQLPVRNLFIPDMQAILFTSAPRWRGVMMSSTKQFAQSPTLVGDFYAPFGLETYFVRMSDAEMSGVFRHVINAYYRHLVHSAEKPTRRLAVHFRGGDIFADNTPVHGFYVQPPATYYILAINHAINCHDFDEIVLVSEDRSNPAIDIVEQHFQRDTRLVKVRARSLEEDLYTMTSSTSIVASYSTFAEVSSLISQSLETVYFFRTASSQDMYKPFSQSKVGEVLKYDGRRVCIVDDASVSYIPPRTWANTETQLSQIRSFRLENLRLYDQ